MTLEPHDAGGARRRRADEHWNRRRDLERQLHDGPALRIAALTVHLGLLAQKVRDGTGDPQHDITELQQQLHIVLQELRAIADRIYPPLLQEAGLGPALRELAGSAEAPVRVDAADGRFDPAVEGVAYFAVLAVLEDRRPATRTAYIVLRRDADGLALDLADVNTGQAVAVRDRIHWLGGSVEVVGGVIKVRIPCA
ncbi:histidine kinase [Micromonosporaceae bacterium Da 78-11]